MRASMRHSRESGPAKGGTEEHWIPLDQVRGRLSQARSDEPHSLHVAVHKQDGFTLIEVVVALAIMSIGLTVLIELFSGGLRLGRTSGEYSKAVNFGRTKMEEVMTQQNIEEGTDEGKFDDTYRWQVDLKKVDILPAEKTGPFDPPVLLYRVTVDVLWKSGSKERSTHLESLRTFKKSEQKKS